MINDFLLKQNFAFGKQGFIFDTFTKSS